jgi:hypothetical protein
MIYFGYPLDIHRGKTKPKTEPDTEPENRGSEIIPKSKPAGPKTRGYPPRTRSAAILSVEARLVYPRWTTCGDGDPTSLELCVMFL